MQNFDQQLQHYKEEQQQKRYPHTEAELDKVILSAVQDGSLIEHKATFPENHKQHRLWSAIAAAAVLAAIIIPSALYLHNRQIERKLTTIDIDGQRIIFSCNKECDPAEVLDNFKTIIK